PRAAPRPPAFRVLRRLPAALGVGGTARRTAVPVDLAVAVVVHAVVAARALDARRTGVGAAGIARMIDDAVAVVVESVVAARARALAAVGGRHAARIGREVDGAVAVVVDAVAAR